MKTGRPTKPAGQAVHRNKPTHETVQLPHNGRPGMAPKPMAPLPKDQAALWRRLWKTPEASQWSEADVPAMTRYVVLASSADSWIEKAVLGELRQLEDRFGLNPYGRRVSKWVKAEDQESQSVPVRRRHLEAVDPRAVAGA